MNTFWKSLLLLVVAAAAARALTCRQCTIDIFGSCLLPSNVGCNATTEQCYFGKAQFTSTNKFTVYTRGCLNSAVCNNTFPGTLLGIGYTSNYSCCSTDLCNGAASLQLPLMVALLSALLSSLWGFCGL